MAEIVLTPTGKAAVARAIDLLGVVSDDVEACNRVLRALPVAYTTQIDQIAYLRHYTRNLKKTLESLLEAEETPVTRRLKKKLLAAEKSSGGRG